MVIKLTQKAHKRVERIAQAPSTGLVQIVTKDFKIELRGENPWSLFAPIPVVYTMREL